jgi:hypothetical protein
MCLYSSILRSLFTGGTVGRIQRERQWLEQYYVGSKARFDAVMESNKNRPIHVFDVIIHVRTLSILEVRECDRPIEWVARNPSLPMSPLLHRTFIQRTGTRSPPRPKRRSS